ncbi:hypothetical protein [Olleya sp. Bg11-27]|uniref:hypothetical protein n=1 Tax=Olleya sp. Bg11-27 TaxID=2058135 RepID=UPI000C31790E|nr:hypothetical protein [Olleya sp. Bg11-27]AUC75670.1 hypothetical protein CW732_08285 [Olleya sp. Bg11-27]
MIESHKINNSIVWWEKKRLWFNVAVGLTGVISILFIWPYLFYDRFIAIILYGIIANIFYSLGMLIELLDSYYHKGKCKFHNYRKLFFLIGTLAYCFVTFYLVRLLYMLQIMDF